MTPLDDVIDPADEAAGADDADTRRWRGVDATLAIVSALVIAWGVFAGGWSLFAVMALFWLENVVIGVFNVVKMLFAGALGGRLMFVGALFLSVFFTLHYGLFTAVHGIFIVMLFGREAGIAGGSGLFEPLGRMLGWLLANREGVIAMMAIVALHGTATVRWIVRCAAGRDHAVGAQLMAAPYGRIVVLHVALILGAALVAALNLPLAGVLLLVALKLAYDLKVALTPGWMPGRRRRQPPAREPGAAPPAAFVRKERFRGRP